jgi:type I restriction enzyme S subunit
MDLVSGRLDVGSMIRTSPEISRAYGRTRLLEDDIIFALRGEIGKLAKVDGQLSGANLTRGVALLSKNETSVRPSFLFWALQSAPTKAAIRDGINGTALKEIPIGNLRKLPVLVPDNHAEQSAIAGVLDAWQRAVCALEHFIYAKSERKRGLMQLLLTGKKRFKEFKGEPWRTVRIGSLLEECDRYVNWRDDQAYQFASIRRRSGGLFNRGTYHGREVKTKVLKLLNAGDFVISKRQVVHGAWAMVPEGFDGFGVSDEYDVLVNRDPKTLDMRFFNCLSQTRRLWHMAYMASNGVHIEKLIFNFSDFAKENLRIPPTVKEQTRIADVIECCDREIDLLQKQLGALKEQKRGLMQKLLTGELRVKV